MDRFSGQRSEANQKGCSWKQPSASVCKLLFLLTKPANRLAGKINPHALYVCIHLQSMLAHFPAVARLLVATKRRCGIEHVIGVDPDNAGFDFLSKPVSA